MSPAIVRSRTFGLSSTGARPISNFRPNGPDAKNAAPNGRKPAPLAVRLSMEDKMAEKPVMLGPPENDFPPLEKLPDRGEEELWDYLEEIYKNIRQARH
jgi:hypothetical protein